ARAGHQDVVLRLLLAGADPDLRWNTGWDEPALFLTTREGFDKLSALLLLADAWPGANQDAAPDTSALLWAASFGREDIVHLLLGLRGSRQIDANARDPFGETPLFAAITSEQQNIVRVLLSAGADPNNRNASGFVPLHFAIGHEHSDIVKLLLAAGADPNGGGHLPLLAACRATGNQEILNLLIEAGARA
ncbi:MAG: ankyrin repeat domain-containing protein, partial [Anaerolineaceae bacterium]|nr:ankyrin repeat domain-containing protein [Anaerolineaceae bacterium]